jgi:hypothetical protein
LLAAAVVAWCIVAFAAAAGAVAALAPAASTAATTVSVVAAASAAATPIAATALVSAIVFQSVGYFEALHLHLHQFFDGFEAAAVVATDEGDGFSFGCCPGRPADAVDVIFSVPRNIEVDDQVNPVDVDASA